MTEEKKSWLAEVEERVNKAASARSDDFGHSVQDCLEFQARECVWFGDEVFPRLLDLVKRLEVENERLSHRALCTWCGYEGPKKTEEMVDHMLGCRRSPLVAALADIDTLRSQLEMAVKALGFVDRTNRLRGYPTPSEWAEVVSHTTDALAAIEEKK